MKFQVLFILTILISSSALASFKVASYNIRNFDYDTRSRVSTNKKHLVKTIAQINADLIGVQEINRTNRFDEMIQSNFQGKYRTVFTQCGGAHDQKLGFVFNSAELQLIDFNQDMRTVNVNHGSQRQSLQCDQGSRPLAVAHFKHLSTNRHIIAITVHLKSGGRSSSIQKRTKQLKAIKKLIDEKRSQGFEHFVVVGDFNSTEYIFKTEGYRRFVGLVREMKLQDTASNLKCTSYWWGGLNDQKQYPSSLDHILVSSSLMVNKNAKAQVYGHCAKLMCATTSEAQMGVSFDQVSDHCPIAVAL